MCSAPVDETQHQSSPAAPPRESCGGASPRFSKLRGVRWRVWLGILPSSVSSSIDDFRRVAADSRRRYASLRRQLLVDPYLSKDGSKSPNLVMDNPLSQNPDSTWGRFFRNAELEKMVDQDLSRLYPEHGTYFQTPTSQAMLRRILLLWCLRHPEYGYRQGMHELLAPLLYVLHVDVQCLSQVRKLHEDQFSDEFDGTYFPESDVVSNYRFTKNINDDGETDKENCFQGDTRRGSSLDELDLDTRDIILVSDAYGAEGELGILPSERFMEHDAYCMFDTLMNGGHGVVAMAEFFSSSPLIGSSTGFPPVIEASSALYHLLSIVDPYVHSHLVELGVEPQYFALRWLRVLYGREFSLDNLLVIWDEIFSYPNSEYLLGLEHEAHFNFRILRSPRGAFVSAMAVSMILHIRSSLLATENATSCLQRLLNFPEKIDLKKLIDNAKALQAAALDIKFSTSQSNTVSERNKPALFRGYSLSSGSVSPKTPLFSLPESYWEEKWRVLHGAEELQKGSQSDPVSKGILNKSSDRRIFSLPRTESDPSPTMIVSGKKEFRSSVRRRLLDDLSHEADSDLGNLGHEEISNLSGSEVPLCVEGLIEKDSPELMSEQSTMERNPDFMGEETFLSEENSLVFSTATTPLSITHDHENDLEKSSVCSSSCAADNNGEIINPAEESHCNSSSNLVLGDAETTTTAVVMLGHTDVPEEQASLVKERKQSSGRFQWFWKFGRGASEGDPEKGNVEAQKAINVRNKEISGSSSAGSSGKADVVDKKVMGTLRNLGQSMLENIQVIESVFQHDLIQVGSLENFSNNILGSKKQVSAMAALKELRKISNLLSEM